MAVVVDGARSYHYVLLVVLFFAVGLKDQAFLHFFRFLQKIEAYPELFRNYGIPVPQSTRQNETGNKVGWSFLSE